MTSTEEHILKILSGATSQNPMSLTDVIAQSGLIEATVITILDNMYHSLPSIVNRAECFKHGVWKKNYWPTGIVATSSKHIVINPRKPQITSEQYKAPRRDELNKAPVQIKPLCK